ncbi:hypothetical protein JL09_g1190 [Pichia kudriavzevii]|uniref:B30.2/SPRY domain-containing protein n=2 Tax=Pichia kudriavzevii TaxID=4909 RepID=A0A099P3Y1_PICKU|nr:hypothetical protein JL09_g1190 [Pichia kudriavzevii]
MPYIIQGQSNILELNREGIHKSDDVDYNDDIWIPVPLVFFSFFITAFILLIILMVQNCISGTSFYDDNDYDYSNLLYDEEVESEQDAEALRTLTPDEQEIYFQAKEFIKLNHFAQLELANWEFDLIREKGVNAWEFLSPTDDHNNVTIENKSEITFHNINTPISVQSNLPLPNTKDIHYVEYKIFDIPENMKDNTMISLGLCTYPYPSFALPGRYLHSVSYDSNGDRRHNNPFPLESLKDGLHAFPPLEKGDVVGVGFRRVSRNIFFTRNGKKVAESKIGGHVKLPKNLKLFPTVGSINPCRVDVNFGQMGFVYIEANVKKWGLAPLRGSEAPPPLYTKFNHDVLLDTSDVEELDLPEFQEIAESGINKPAEFTDDERGDDQFTLDTIEQPPYYKNLIEDEIREAMNGSVDQGTSADP